MSSHAMLGGVQNKVDGGLFSVRLSDKAGLIHRWRPYLAAAVGSLGLSKVRHLPRW